MASKIIASVCRALLAVCLVTSSVLVDNAAAQMPAMVADDAEVQLVSDDFQFTEGPAVDRQGNVFFTDQPNDRILKYSVDGELETWLKPAGRSNGLFFDQQGNLIACADGKNELWRIKSDKSHEVLLDGFDGKLFNGPNDVWVNSDGDFYFTDPYYRRPYWNREVVESQLPKRVYRLSAGEVTIAADEFEQPNGIVGDAKRKLLFVADIGANKTYRFRIGDDGQLTDRTLFCNQGSDGMTLDQDGNLYLTGQGVIVYDKEGKHVGNIAVPERWTANVCFGGADRDVLFITASDSLYTLKMKSRGL